MKHLIGITIFFLFLISKNTVLFSQTLYVLDNYSHTPISGVSVKCNNISIGETDSKGRFIAGNLVDTCTLTLSHPIYFTKVFTASLKTQIDTIYLNEKILDLDELVVSASRFEEKKSDIPRKVETIRRSDMEQMNQSNSADLLSSSGKVFVQKSQLGGGSPVIRGMETNRILLVVDGVTLNNGIYRGGHLQNVITIDQGSLENVELTYGPGAVVYGSDALGGVIHFKTLSNQYSKDSSMLVKSKSYLRFISSNLGFSANGNVILGWKKFSSVTGITYSSFGDLIQGSKRRNSYPDFGKRDFYVRKVNSVDSMFVNDDPNTQIGSGYSQYDFLQKFGFRPNNHIEHTLNFQLSNSSKISRYDRLTQTKNNLPRYGEWYYGPQLRTFLSYVLTYKKRTSIFDEFKINLNQQYVEESRHDRLFKQFDLNNRNEQVYVTRAMFDFEKKADKHELRYGLYLSYDQINSRAFTTNINDGNTKNLDTRYPDGGSNILASALYLSDSWEISNKFILSGGLRLNYNRLQAKFKSKEFFPFPYNQARQEQLALNGNLGLVYMPNKSWRFTLIEATGFRSPNLDDLTKVFESTTSTSTVPGKLIVPNPDLKPEHAYSTEIGVHFRNNDKLQLSINAYFTFINNLIAVLPDQFNGSDTILYSGEYSNVYSAQNSNYGNIYGLEVTIKYQPLPNLFTSGSVSYNQGELITQNGTTTPLDHIPPLYGKLSIEYNLKNFKIELFSQFNGWKKLADYSTSGEDNLPYATADGMPSWITYNLRIGARITNSLHFQASCENIFNTNYRVFSSNISAPGRSFNLTLRLNTFN